MSLTHPKRPPLLASRGAAVAVLLATFSLLSIASTPSSTSSDTCTNSCEYANDGECDDGRPGADYDLCAYGTDCNDCSGGGGGGGGCLEPGEGECESNSDCCSDICTSETDGCADSCTSNSGCASECCLELASGRGGACYPSSYCD